ncbi:hypothetical protein LINPERPRIM_LOCUS10055, partial [Linum perenne]
NLFSLFLTFRHDGLKGQAEGFLRQSRSSRGLYYRSSYAFRSQFWAPLLEICWKLVLWVCWMYKAPRADGALSQTSPPSESFVGGVLIFRLKVGIFGLCLDSLSAMCCSSGCRLGSSVRSAVQKQWERNEELRRIALPTLMNVTMGSWCGRESVWQGKTRIIVKAGHDQVEEWRIANAKSIGQ